MKRREVLGVLSGAAAWPLAAPAQQGERVRRIGFLHSAAASAFAEHMPAGLSEVGYFVGRLRLGLGV
jgi:putative ABC transport system substrate-binding protein